MQTIQFIDKQVELEQLAEELSANSWVAVDTEFLREKTYFPKFCLLQIGTPERVALIDTLALPELQCLDPILYNPCIMKVFHSCRQDMEIFYHLNGRIPAPVFDTQLAAPLLGFQENTGYSMLVSSLLKVNLSKAHTRTDWSSRPLSQEQMQYAAEDVIYLCELYEKVNARLLDLGRRDWLDEDLKALEDDALYHVVAEKAWLKIKGKNKLTGKQLAVLQCLAAWRENTARSENRPKNWLLRDDLLLDMAKLQPTDIKGLFKLRNINERIIKRHGTTLSQIIREAKEAEPINLGEVKSTLKKSQQQEAIIDILAAVVRIRADENMLNPSILATRKDLEMLLFDQRESRLNHGWRHQMVGRELTSILSGRYALRMQSGEMNVFETG